MTSYEQQLAIIEKAKERAYQRLIEKQNEIAENKRIEAIVKAIKADEKAQRKAMKAKDSAKKFLIPLGYASVKVPFDMPLNERVHLIARLSNESHSRATIARTGIDNSLVPTNIVSQNEPIESVKPESKGKRKKSVAPKNSRRAYWHITAFLNGKNLNIMDSECSKCSKSRRKSITRSQCGHTDLNHNGLVTALKHCGLTLTKKQDAKLKELVATSKVGQTSFVSVELKLASKGTLTLTLNRIAE